MPGPSAPAPSPRERLRNAVQAVVDQKAAEKQTTRRVSAAERARQLRRPLRRRWQAAALFLVFVISVIVAIPRWRTPFQPPAGAAAQHNARRAIVFAAHLVDQYVKTRGQPPANLAELRVELPGMEYTRVENSWRLSMAVEGRTITFVAGDDPTQFLGGRQPAR